MPNVIDTEEKRELRRRVFDEQTLNRIEKSFQPRMMKKWILAKEGFDIDYSDYDAEGRPH